MFTDAQILLADDEPHFLSATARALTRVGYQCDTALDATRCRALLRQSPYDALLADIYMPGNSQLELIAELPSDWPPPAVILMTGKPSIPSAINAIKLPVSAYLVKPFTLDRLLGELQDALERRRRLLEQMKAPPLAAPELREARRLLSPREVQVLDALLVGRRVPDIASTMELSPHTVRNHLKHIYRKLDVHSQTDLIRRFGKLALT